MVELKQRGKKNVGANLKLNGASVCWVKSVEKEVGVSAGICRRGRNYQSTQWHTDTDNSQTTHVPSFHLHGGRIGSIFAWTCPHSQPHWDTPRESGEDSIYSCQNYVDLEFKMGFNVNQ